MRNLALVLVLLLLCGCTGNDAKIIEVPKETAGSAQEYVFIPFQELPAPTFDPELAGFFPSEIDGLLPLNYFTDPLGNDLSLAAPLEVESILSSIEKAAGTVYLEPENSTDVLVFYRVYKMNESRYSRGALEAYKNLWNKEGWKVAGKEVWVWKGYEEQIAANQFPFPAGEPLYWDPETEAVYFFQSSRPLPVVALLNSNLYGLHGEAAFGEYFIMIDVQGRPRDIETRARNVFSSIFSQEGYQELYGSPIENVTAQPPVDEFAGVKEKIKSLNEDYYVRGDLSEEEYDSALEGYLKLLSEVDEG